MGRWPNDTVYEVKEGTIETSPIMEDRDFKLKDQISACVQADPKDVEYGYIRKLSGRCCGNGNFGDNHTCEKQPGTSGSFSKAASTNPKDLLGVKKADLTKIPAAALVHESLAMLDGAQKYGPYNWRSKAVVASIYIAACKRHLDLWFEGQRSADDSHVHHLGHARACLGILLDAEATGNLIDDRPVTEGSSEAIQRVYDEAAKIVEFLSAKNAKNNASNGTQAGIKGSSDSGSKKSI